MLKLLEGKGWRRKSVTQASTEARFEIETAEIPTQRAPQSARTRDGDQTRPRAGAGCASRWHILSLHIRREVHHAPRVHDLLRDQIAKLNGSAKPKARPER